MGLQLTWYFGFLGDNAEVLGYGHLGDGNLHLNILSSKYDDNVCLLYQLGSGLFTNVMLQCLWTVYR
jgi:hypothetical protein